MFLRLVLIIFLVLAVFMRAMPHEAESEQDTIFHYPEKNLSHKTILGKFIHNHILNSKVTTIDYDYELQEKESLPSTTLKGKIIRHIYITNVDPFGYSLQDTTIKPVGFTKQAGNFLHISTKERVIRNLLLVHPLQAFDSLLFKESERLIRMQKYVHDVIAYPLMDSPKADSVDLYFRVIDIWSIVPTFRKAGPNDEAGLADNNFIGSGNRIQVDTRFGRQMADLISQWGYTISNIRNSHVTGSFQYYLQGNEDPVHDGNIRKPAYSALNNNLSTLNLSNRYLVRSVELYRPFFSPLTKWAGGIFIGQLATLQNYIENDSVRYLSSKTNIQDYWGAVALPLLKSGGLAARTSRIIFSVRLLKTRYPKPISVSETIHLFNNENFYFAGFGITSRRFIQDRYVFNYGKVEDIPVGRAFGITTGIYMQRNKQFYLGLKAAWGNNYRFGYFSTHLEYGTFIASNGFRQQVITARASYYTPLFNAGYWRIRQFIKPVVTVGINRLPTDNLSLGEVINGFDELKNPATQMMALTLQTQSYSPWEIYGFRFGPYFFSSLGLLSHHENVKLERFYAALGLGVLIKNNYLLINTFQVSFTFYPFLPESGYDFMNLNTYKTTDYGLKDFEISKPQVVEYR